MGSWPTHSTFQTSCSSSDLPSHWCYYTSFYYICTRRQGWRRETKKELVMPEWISNQATGSTFMSVSMCELMQMFLCIMSFCAFCGCHHFYSYSGRGKWEEGVSLCVSARVLLVFCTDHWDLECEHILRWHCMTSLQIFGLYLLKRLVDS